jgi:UMF1 family MFS transporter
LPLRNGRVLAWAMYDWANSAYTTLLITVLVAYIQRVVFPAETWGETGAVVWAWGISLSMLVGAILSPLLGAIADAGRTKDRWLAITAFTGAAAGIGLGVVPPRYYVTVVALFVIANVMLELSLGIYHGFLRDIVPSEQINSASAWGYGLGYLGGGIALGIAMLLLRFGDVLGIPTDAARLRWGLVLMGSWWGLFTLPAVIVLRTRGPRTAAAPAAALRHAWRDVAGTLREIRVHRSLALFLLSFLFYNDGVQTVISQASTFALRALEFSEGELMAVILMIQVLAMPGALLIGWGADQFGEKRILLFCLAVWSAVLLIALAIDSHVGFWLLSGVIALVLGGTQSVSRALMASLIPPNRDAQYFGFFNLSGKVTSFLGPFLFGAIVALTGSSRMAIFGLIPFFLIGAWLLWKVRVPSSEA